MKARLPCDSVMIRSSIAVMLSNAKHLGRDSSAPPQNDIGRQSRFRASVESVSLSHEQLQDSAKWASNRNGHYELSK
jgi:hypothetical protein